MSSNMEKAIRLMVRTNLTQREIANKLDISEETVSRYKKKKNFDEIRQKEEREYLGSLAGPALRVMKELLESRSDYVRYNAASNILDRTGYKPTDKVDMNVTVPEIVFDVPLEDDD